MKKLEQLRSMLKEKNADAIFINSPANRQYLTGFTGTAGAVLVTQEQAFFITDFRYIEQAKSQCEGFEIIEQTSSVLKSLQKKSEELKWDRLAFEKDHLTYASFEQLRAHTEAELLPVEGLVEEIRLYKNKDELAVIQQAVDIADRAFEHITTYIEPGRKEIEVSNELEFFMREQGAVSSSFDIIVASGTRSALPHGVATEKEIESGDLVTLDFGAYFQGYCSDITRTVAVGEPSNELKRIYQTVYEAQWKAVEEIKPGMTGVEADAIAREYITKAGFGRSFGHGLGHGLGMEVHEGPRLSPKGEHTLEPGMVVTVEPGIYVPGVGGTRIEDDIVITDKGNERLSQSPKELMIIGK
ncbi:aminopeptidase P family protein [Salibacterium salarium]|uniref:Aminopeptidase P family protein n=1 Tax=Salibacterium salarium TaxID=284579 RepID=A0A428N832_9BACI|nr:Xaa-Pro peptidase family protein [Salibacterium salarium]RSL34552.1 aminopeptidase P family protein [Salibacterium salarium]